MFPVDRLHAAIYNNELAYVARELQPVQAILQNFPAFIATQLGGAPIDIARLIISYSGETNPPSTLLSSTLSERSFALIGEDLLLNTGPTRVPKILIDALFVASLTMHNGRDNSMFSLLLAAKAPVMNTFTFNPYSLQTDALRKQYTPATLEVFQEQMTLMEQSDPQMALYKEIFAENSSPHAILILHDIICTQWEYENDPEQRDKEVLSFLNTLTPFRMVTEIVLQEYNSILLPHATKIVTNLLQVTMEHCKNTFSPDFPIFLKYSIIQPQLLTHAEHFSAEEIRYARSQVCLLLQANAVPLCSYLPYPEEDDSEAALTRFHLFKELLLEEKRIDSYRAQFGADAFPPFGRLPFPYEVPQYPESELLTMSDNSDEDQDMLP